MDFEPRNALLTIDQVKDLPVGSKVTLNGYDRRGNHTILECTVVQSGRKKVLEYVDRSNYFQIRTKDIKNYPNKWYTEGWRGW